jgi:hypothetical protein
MATNAAIPNGYYTSEYECLLKPCSNENLNIVKVTLIRIKDTTIAAIKCREEQEWGQE